MTVFAFPANTPGELLTVLEGNKEYSGRLTASLGRVLSELYVRRNRYLQESKVLPEVVAELYRQYCARCKAEEIRAAELPNAGKDTLPVSENPEWLEYYLETAKIPVDVQKNYFSCNAAVAFRHIEEQAAIVRRLFAECESFGEFVRRQGSALMNGGADNLFYYLCALEEKAGAAETKKAALLLRDVAEKKLAELAALFDKCGGEPFATYQKKRDARKLGAGKLAEGEEPCENALDQILSFAGVSEEIATEFTGLLKKFAALEDKTSTEDWVRRLRRQISDIFYQIYEIIFRKTYGLDDTDIALPIRLFLEFGFVDETLISRAQMLELEKLVSEPVSTEASGCHIFTVREWLSWVYEGKREPSKNEFDQEYSEMLREQKKAGQITEEEEKAKLKDYDERLHYEIQNLFRYNHRLVNGQLSIFVPFLYEELLGGEPERCFTPRISIA